MTAPAKPKVFAEVGILVWQSCSLVVSANTFAKTSGAVQGALRESRLLKSEALRAGRY